MTEKRSWIAAGQVSYAVGTHARVLEATEARTRRAAARGARREGGGAGVAVAESGGGAARGPAPGRGVRAGGAATGRALTRITIAPR